MRTRTQRLAIILATFALVACAQEPVIRVGWFDSVPSTRSACEKMVSKLPKTLADESAWELTSDKWDTEHLERVSAAWGDPIIVLKCGLREVPETPITKSTVAGIDWNAFEVVSGYRYTSTNLSKRIAVTIPEVYDANAILTELAPYLSDN
jgi:hypothetical protein